MGFLVLIIGFYYIQAGREEVRPLLQWSLYCRPAGFVFFAALVSLGLAKPMLILFGAIDLLGAV